MKRLLLFIIRGYQHRISPLIPSVCRFYPSCSEYACQALEKYSLLKALGLIVYRLMRCQPFCAGGYDPVK